MSEVSARDPVLSKSRQEIREAVLAALQQISELVGADRMPIRIRRAAMVEKGRPPEEQVFIRVNRYAQLDRATVRMARIDLLMCCLIDELSKAEEDVLPKKTDSSEAKSWREQDSLL